MPPALDKLIPITQPSSHRHISQSQDLKKPKRRVASRVYDEHYLPIAPSQLAPRYATITDRVADAGQVSYSLNIGGVEFSDVGLHEILDYVSAFELERFENAQFVEERELLSVLEEEARQERAARRQLRRQQREQQIQPSEGSSNASDDEEVHFQVAATPAAVGKHGRARPTYKHLYMQPEALQAPRRRRKRDPDIGELLSLSEDDGGFVTHTAVQEPPVESKRRRRKRDKLTGELLPLSPKLAPKVVVKRQPAATYSDSLPAVPGYVQNPAKRPRRRRHPITNELMPLGWKYDPAVETNKVSSGDALKNLSIAGQDQPSAKRPRLQNRLSRTRESSESLSSSSRQLVPSIFIDRIDSTTPKSGRYGNRASVIPPSLPEVDMSDSDDAMIDADESSHIRTSLTHPNAKRISGNSSGASSAEIITVSTFQKPESTAANPEARDKTSMLNPTMTPAIQSVNNSDDGSDDGEFVIEGILQHRMSDPKTHLPEFGHRPIRLYQVKWEGYDELTWEPIESFPDRSIIQEYHQRVGLKYGNSMPSASAASTVDRGNSPAKREEMPSPVTTNDIKSPTYFEPPLDDKALPSKKPSANNKMPTNGDPPLNTKPSPKNKPSTNKESHTDSKPPAKFFGKPVSISGKAKSINFSRDESSSPPTPKNEYVVEAILGHHMSDPKTHPSNTGGGPVMLYHVKWESYDELTWEPIESFPVRSIVLEYRERHGLHRPEASSGVVQSKKSASRVEAPPIPVAKRVSPQGNQKKEQQRMQWNALMAASQKSGKSAQQLDGDDSSDG